MPVIRPLLLCLLMLSPSAMADERLSLQLSGGYIELEGFTEFDVTITPSFMDPGNPGNVVTLPPADVETPLPIRDDDVSWEATHSYRLWRTLHLQCSSICCELIPLPGTG